MVNRIFILLINFPMLKTDTGNILKPEQFERLSDTDKETAIKVLGNAGLSAWNTDLQTATIIITLSPIITSVQACTVFNILNRIEKLVSVRKSKKKYTTIFD